MATITNRIVWASNTDELKAKILAGSDAIVAMKNQVDRTAQSLGGSGLLSAANKVTAAVDQLGGATKLTAAEQTKINTLLGKAVEKYEALGLTAPPAMRELYDATKHADDATEGLGARVTGIVEASRAAAGAIQEVVGIAREWTDAYSAQENATTRLDSALRSQGTYTPQLSAQYAALATQFERTTAFADELVQESEAMLVTIGNVMPQDMERALQASTDLAAGLRIDLGSATQLVAKALEGNVGALKRHGITLDEATVKAKGATVVFDALEQKFGGQAQAQAHTFSGEMSKLGNVIDNVQETLGGFIAGALSPLIDGFLSIPEPIRTGIVVITLLGTAAGATAIAVGGLGAAAALAAPVFGFEAAGIGAAMLTGLGTAASGAALALWPVAAAIAAVWAAWKIGNTETVKNSIAEWALSADNLTARLYRWSMGLDQLSPAQAKAAVEATAAAEAAAKQATAMGAAATSAGDLAAKLNGFIGPQMDANTESRIYEEHLKKQEEASRKASDEAAKHAKELEHYHAVVADVLLASQGYDAVLDTINGSVIEGVKYYREQGVAMDKIGQMYQLSQVQLDALTQAEQAETDSLKAQASAINTVATQMERRLKLIPKSAGQVLDEAPPLQKFDPAALAKLNQYKPPNIWQSFANDAKDFFSGGGFGKTITGALMGGGGLKGGLQAAASDLGGMFSQNLGASAAKAIGGTVGNVVGSFIGPLGSLLGPAIGKIGSWIGNTFFHSQEKEVNKTRQAYVDAAGGLDVLNARAHAAGVTLDAVLNAKKPQDYTKAVNDLNAALKFQDDAMATLDATVKKYNFSVDQIGPILAKQELDKKFGELFQDWQVLKSSGMDLDTIISGMGSSVNDFVHDAMKTGTEIPAAMAPLLQRMVELGQLTDSNGNAITDLDQSGVKFSMTMTEGVTKIVESVQKLTDAITRGLGLAIRNIPDPEITGHVRWNVDSVPTSDSGGLLPTDQYANVVPLDNMAATGGLVTQLGIQRFTDGGNVLSFKPMGTDTVPAMLTPGEIVLNVAQQRRVANAVGGGGVVVNFDAMRQEIAALRQQNANLTDYMRNQLSRDLSRATRDEVQKVSWRRSRA